MEVKIVLTITKMSAVARYRLSEEKRHYEKGRVGYHYRRSPSMRGRVAWFKSILLNGGAAKAIVRAYDESLI